MKTMEKNNLEDLLLQTQFIQVLNADDKKTVVANTRFIPFSKGENIFKQGATINEFVVLLTGLAKVSVENSINETATIIKMLAPVSLLSVSSMYDTTYKATAVAMTYSMVAFIDKTTVLNIIKNNPKCMMALLEYSHDFITEAVQQIVDFGQKTIKSRVACSLLRIARFAENDFIDIPISRNDIAQYSGIATGSTIRLLADLEKDGIIVLDKKTIKIVNKEELIRISKIDTKEE